MKVYGEQIKKRFNFANCEYMETYTNKILLFRLFNYFLNQQIL